VKEEGYTQVEKRNDGGTVTKTFESKTITTKYGDDGKIITSQGEQWGSGKGNNWGQGQISSSLYQDKPLTSQGYTTTKTTTNQYSSGQGQSFG